MNRLQRIARRLQRQSGRAPSVKELSAALGWPQARVNLLQRMTQDPVHLGSSLCKSGVDEMLAGDVVLAPCDAEREVLDGMLGQDLRQALWSLDARARHVLVRRYGLDGQDQQTLPEIGRDLSLSKQRVHQIQRAGAERLREVLIEQGYGPE